MNDVSIQIPVHGMKCQKCVAKVTRLIQEFPEVSTVDVSLEQAQAHVTAGQGEALPVDRIQSRLAEEGFPDQPIDTAPSEKEGQVSQQGSSLTSRLRIRGMSCSNCATAIENGVAQVPGVRASRVNFAAEILSVEYADDSETLNRIRSKVQDLGYSIAPEASAGQFRFAISGMSCASCAAIIEKKLKALPGMKEVQVNLAGNFGHVSFDPEQLDEPAILSAVAEAGYKGQPIDLTSDSAGESRRALYWVLISAAGAVPIMLQMVWPVFGAAGVYVSLVLASLVQFSAGLTFYRGAYKSLRNKSASMDVLVALGISAAYGYSLLAVFGLLGSQATVFFETSTMLILFIRFGKWLESRAKGQAGAALKKLLQLQADKAVLLVDGEEREVAASQVKPGDRLLVRAGEKIPVDGVVIEGSAAVDEAMISGEAVPVSKQPGDQVVGATINRSGRLLVRASHVGEDTVLAQIVRMVEEAQGDKAPIQRLADRVSAYFVPAVVLISLVTFITWYLGLESSFLFAFQMAIAVVVIACPCALGLATPTAIMVGSSVGLERGILIKRASVLEEISRIEVLLLDKTGTLTSGDFQVDEVLSFTNESADEVLRLAAAMEEGSNHPLARGIVQAARRKKLQWQTQTDLEEHGGHGLSGVVDGRMMRCGNQKFLQDAGVDLQAAQETVSTFASAGKSLVYLSRERQLLGLLALSDSLKANAPEAMKRLRRLGLSIVLLTGDRRQAARAVAETLGIDAVEAEVLPDQKLQLVKKYQKQGKLVAMVGDGINDAPALARADIGIAIGSGTDVAKETGDLILVGGDLFDIERGIRLGRQTLLKIKQNLFWAFFYNLLGIPLAAGLLYPWFGLYLKPEFAGLAMAFSSVSVVANSLLLRRMKTVLEKIK